MLFRDTRVITKETGKISRNECFLVKCLDMGRMVREILFVSDYYLTSKKNSEHVLSGS